MQANVGMVVHIGGCHCGRTIRFDGRTREAHANDLAHLSREA